MPTRDAIKHSQILEDIAGSLGMKPDAMMHFLKQSGNEPTGTAPRRENLLEIGEHFPETLSRRLSARLADLGTVVSPWLVLLALAQAIEQSPTDVGQALGGQTYSRPGKVLVYDEFHRIGGQNPAETFREMFPVFYVREDSLRATGNTTRDKALKPIGNGWYSGER